MPYKAILPHPSTVTSGPGRTHKATLAHPACGRRYLCFCMVKGGSGCNEVRGLPALADLGNAAVGALWQQRLVDDAMMRHVAGRGRVARSCPSRRRGPAQAPGSLAAQKEEQRQELEALRAELEEERLRTQELRRCFAAKTWELKAALDREQQLLADRLQSEWEQRKAGLVRQLQELNQRQRVAETRQLLRWKEAELHESQELLQQECTATVRQTRDLQRQLAKEMVRPSRSRREAQRKLQDVLSKLHWETDGDQPACIRHLQNQLQLERRLFIKYILQRSEGELPTSPTGTAQPQGPSGHQGPQETESSRSSGRNGPQALVALQKSPLGSHSAGQQTTGKAVADAQLQVPEREDLVLLGSTRRRLLEQKTCLQRLLEHLKRQQSALERENHLLEKEGSPEAREEAERMQQQNGQLAALASQLEEKCRQLQATIDRLTNAQVPPPAQSSAEELCTASFPQETGGEVREPDRALLAQDKQSDFSQKAVEELQAQEAADEGSSSYVNTRCRTCEELQVRLTEMTIENAQLAEENARLRGQVGLTEQVQVANADLRGQLAQVAEERGSAIQMDVCLRTQLEEAERELKAMREMAKRSQQLEAELEETKLALQRKEKEGKRWQRAQREAHREHQETLQFLQAHLTELNDLCQKLNKVRQQLFQKLEQPERERSNRIVSRLCQASLVADKESILREAMRKQPAKLRAFIARYSYDPFDGPNERPEAELPLVAGQSVYIFGDVDEDGWYVGELTDGSRGFVPSNLVEEDSDGGRPDDTRVSPERSDW
ncbi:RIMS-binding protein 3A-like [Grus japonensis]|uniref:RIMS-binding protein 3A-like n=1 Tax=Grus japonensis TaxID=30415 RepID=A0ABC9WXT0_GRUJA